MKRNDFFKAGLVAALGLDSLVARGIRASEQKTPGPLPRRPLGRTGEYLSVIGLGGVTLMDEPQAHCNDLVAECFAAGVNYFDVAPTYGNAQDRLGPALEPYRSRVFLACKTAERDRAAAENELNTSLEKLRTDYLDLYQIHGIKDREEVEKVFGPDGALETFVKAKEQGKVRYLGFSAHSVEAAFYAMEHYAFDTILFPFNYNLWFKEQFGPQVMEKAHGKGMGLLALKSCAHSARAKGEKSQYNKCWYRPLDTEEALARGLYFTLSLPVTAALPPGEEQFFRMALKLAVAFVPLDESEKNELAVQAQSVENSLFSYPAWQG